MHNDWNPVISRLPMSVEFSRKRADRLSWVPVRINDKNEVQPVEYHGSAHINALPEAHGLLAVQVGTSIIKKGILVDVRQI
jgi:molybdopterin molybdotransferase